MKVYVVIQLIELENGYRQPKILGVYSKKSLAEKIAYSDANVWCSILECKLDKDNEVYFVV